MPSIEEQLRSFPVPPRKVLLEAAREIERLRQEIRRLEEARFHRARVLGIDPPTAEYGDH